MSLFNFSCCRDRRQKPSSTFNGSTPAHPLWIVLGTPAATYSVMQMREKIPALAVAKDLVCSFPEVLDTSSTHAAQRQLIKTGEYLYEQTRTPVLVDMAGAMGLTDTFEDTPGPLPHRTCLVYKPLQIAVEEAGLRGGLLAIRRELLHFAFLYQGNTEMNGASRQPASQMLQHITRNDFHNIMRLALGWTGHPDDIMAENTWQKMEYSSVRPGASSSSPRSDETRSHALKLRPILTFLEHRLGLTTLSNDPDPAAGVWVVPNPDLKIDKIIDVAKTPMIAELMRGFIYGREKTSNIIKDQKGQDRQNKKNTIMTDRLLSTCLAQPIDKSFNMNGSNDVIECLACDFHPRASLAKPITTELLASLDTSQPFLAGTDMMSIIGSLGNLGSHAIAVVQELTVTDSGDAIPPLVIPSIGHIRSIFIYCHGLGGSGPEAAEATNFTAYQRTLLPSTCGVFPTGPLIPISLFLGSRMRGWFDVQAINFEESKEDVDGFLQSTKIIHNLIDSYHHQFSIPFSRIILGGFSQGGALSVFAGLTYPSCLGGIVCLSSYAPLQTRIQNSIQSRRMNIDASLPPIFMAHGRTDLVIPFNYGLQSAKFLRDLVGPDYLTTVEYDIAHQLSTEELNDVFQWVSRRVNA